MPLGADLSVHLDIGGPVGALLGALGTAGGSLGAIVPPLDPATRDSAAGAASGISLDAIGAALARVSGAVTPLLDRIPGVENALPEIETALALLEQTATPDLTQRITDLLGRLDATLEAERGGTLGQVLRVLEIVKSAPEAGLLRDLASQIERLLGGQPLSDTAFAGFAEILPALSGAAAALGGMAQLDSVLEEAERLSGLAAAQLDRDALTGIEGGDRRPARRSAGFAGGVHRIPRPGRCRGGRQRGARIGDDLRPARRPRFDLPRRHGVRRGDPGPSRSDRDPPGGRGDPRRNPRRRSGAPRAHAGGSGRSGCPGWSRSISAARRSAASNSC